MATIGERAMGIYPIEPNVKVEIDFGRDANFMKRDGYIQGATDQRNIDVEKACEVFDKLMMDYEMERKSHDECLAEMRKAMKED